MRQIQSNRTVLNSTGWTSVQMPILDVLVKHEILESINKGDQRETSANLV